MNNTDILDMNGDVIFASNNADLDISQSTFDRFIGGAVVGFASSIELIDVTI